MRTYGINVVSLVPWVFGPNGPERSINMAAEAGFDGIQVLPIRGWSYKGLRNWYTSILAFEDAWNYGPLWQALLRELHVIKDPAPRLYDWLLFGKRYSTYIPKAILCAHHAISGAAVEIHPELWTKRSAYVSYFQHGGKLCWDTWHVRRPQRDGGLAVDGWRELLEILPSEAVTLIHVHPSKKEAGALLRGERIELTDMLKLLGKKFSAPVILEVFPPLKSPKGTIRYLNTLLYKTKLRMEC